MSNVSEFIFQTSVSNEEGVAFLKATNYNPKAALKWFIRQVVTGEIQPEEYRNAVCGK